MTMWKIILELNRSQITILCMRIACRKPKATNTHSEFLINTAFPQQQWLVQTLSMLCPPCSNMYTELRQKCAYLIR
jgi:hypothetical protein